VGKNKETEKERGRNMVIDFDLVLISDSLAYNIKISPLI